MREHLRGGGGVWSCFMVLLEGERSLHVSLFFSIVLLVGAAGFYTQNPVLKVLYTEPCPKGSIHRTLS